MEINRPVATVILFIVNAVLVFLFVWPEYRNVRTSEVSLKEKRATYNGQAIYYGNIAKTLSEIESRAEVLDKVESALPDKFALAPVAYFFQRKGIENGMVVRSIVFSGNSSVANSGKKNPVSGGEKETKEIMLTLDLYGNYEGLKNYLVSIEKSARLFEVERVSFTSASLVSGRQSQENANGFKLEIITHSY